jgi:signal transduction histidine kinase
MQLSEALRMELLDPRIWREGLTTFARATNLAVSLTDGEGHLLGECFHPRPTWSMLRREQQSMIGACPFCIQPLENRYNCSKHALETRTTLATSDSAGLVHMTVPLFLFKQPLGTLLTGQVFDHYPNHLQLYKLAEKLHIPLEKVWRSARAEYPIRREALQVYGKLLETLGNAFVQARYQAVIDKESLTEMVRLRDSSAQLATEQRELASQPTRQIEITSGILEQTREELRVVTGRLVSAQEDERERMARELHDSIGQDIIAFQFDVHALQQAIPNKVRQQLQAQFEALAERISQIVNSVRHLSHELHPSILSDLDFEDVVRELGERMRKQHYISVRFSARNVPRVIEPSVSLGLYRIIQEALQNVVKHAAAAAVEMALLGRPDCLEVSITDNGKGFAPAEKTRGLGLINMAQRADLLGGTLNVESHPGQGTKICVRVPFRLPPT